MMIFVLVLVAGVSALIVSSVIMGAVTLLLYLCRKVCNRKKK